MEERDPIKSMEAEDSQLFTPEYSAENPGANTIALGCLMSIIVMAAIGAFGIIYHFIDFMQWILN